MPNIAFLGCGKMGQAMVTGILRSGLYSPAEIRAYDPAPAVGDWLRERGIAPLESNAQAVTDCAMAVLLCKPYQSRDIITEIRGTLPLDAVFVSIPLGLDLAALESMFGAARKLVRAMPNMPALVGEGMSGYCAHQSLTDTELAAVEALLGAFGRCERVSEAQMAAVTAVSGSAPAYVFLLIEAMADAAVREGMPRDTALRFAAQAVRGSACLLQETNSHPAVLKDSICTPGGSTIEAVAALEEAGFRSAVLRAMSACAKRAGE